MLKVHFGSASIKQKPLILRMRWPHTVLHYFQKRGFEVCRRIAESMGIRTRVVRTTFIYLTFITVGFGFALYLFLAFWLRIKDLVYTKRTSVFDL